MPWVVYENHETDTVHVVPCDEDGDTEHVLNERCRCHPWHDDQRAAQGTRPLLIHNHIQ
jgi:hypothetical protein